MKKTLSLILILSIVCTLVLTLVKAEDTFGISYTLPSRLNATYGKNIPVNIGEVKVVFTEAVAPNSISGITFTESVSGVEPKGGILPILAGNTLTVKFGELETGKTYNLYLPTSIMSESGKKFEGATIDFITCGQKVLIDHDFSDTTKWPVGTTYTVPATEAYLQGGSYSADFGYFRLKAYSDAIGKATTLKITENGTLNLINGPSTGDIFMSSNFTPTFNAKFVAQWRFKVNAGFTQSGDHFAGLYSGLKTPLTNHGLSLSNMTTGFSKDENDFYDITVYASRLETAVDGQNVTFENKIDAVDNLSGNTAKTPHSSTATGNAVTNKDDSSKAIVLSRFNIVKSYRANNDIEFAKLRQGFFVLPQVLKRNGYEEALGAVTYTMTTDIDPATLTNVMVNGKLVNATFDFETRKILVPFELENIDYEISLKGIKSADGFSFEYEDVLLNIPEIKNVALKDAKTNEVVSDILRATNLKLTFDYKNTEYEKTLQAIIAEYEGDVLKNVKVQDVVLLPNLEETVEVPYTIVNKTLNMKIMATLWDMKRLVPVCSEILKNASDAMLFEAESYDKISDGLVKIADSTAIGGWTADSYLAYEDITLTPYHTLLTARLLPYQAGRFEIRANSPTGKLMGTIVIPAEDALFGNTAIDESLTSQYKEYSAVLDVIDIENPFDLYIVCVDAIGCSTDWYKITPVDVKATEYSLVANTGFYLNPLTANKANISVLDENNNSYSADEVYYTPLTGENDGLLEVLIENNISSLSDYTIVSSTVKDLSGKLTELSLDATVKYKLPQSDNDAYLSDFFIANDGDVVLNIENPANSSCGVLEVSVAVIRNNEIFKEKTVKANLLDTDNVVCECTLDGYAPQTGDSLKLCVYTDNQVHIKNSGFVFDIK